MIDPSMSIATGRFCHVHARTTEFLPIKPVRPMDFLDHMIDACSAAQAGFYFEEGGCIGMAIALHDALREDGRSPRFVSMKRTAHVAVAVDGAAYDHQGECSNPQAFDTITREELLTLGNEWSSDIESDTAWAREVISVAREFVSAPAPTP
jgi:hypothetical protein